MTTPTPGPSDLPAPPPAGPWASDNLPQHPMSGYQREPVPQPPPVTLAVRLMFVGAVLSLLGALFSLTQIDSIRDTIEDDNPELTASEVDTAVSIAVASTVVVGLIGVGLWVWMAIKNGQGRSWARVVATVLGGLNILFTLLGFAGETTALTVAVSIVSVVLAGVILFLLYRPESNRFYDFASRP